LRCSETEAVAAWGRGGRAGTVSRLRKNFDARGTTSRDAAHPCARSDSLQERRQNRFPTIHANRKVTSNMKKLTFIFDYDGTLCDTLDAISDSLVLTFRNFSGRAPEAAEIKALIGTGKTLEETIQELRVDEEPLEAAALKEWVTFYRGQYNLHAEAKVTLFEGVVESLDAVGRVGNVVLLSNKGIHAVQSSLRHFGIEDRFHLVLAEEPGQPRKPQADVFSMRIAPVLPGISASDCVVVGDTAADLEFARNIGAHCCFASYGYGDVASCEAIGYTHVLRGISDLVSIYAADPVDSPRSIDALA